MKADQVQPRARHQCGQSLHEFHRRNHNVCCAVAPRGFELEHNVAFAVDAQAMKVLIASALGSYTERGTVNAKGITLAAVLADLGHQYPDIRFRTIDEQDQVRRHIRIFIGDEQVRDLTHALNANDEVMIVQALSGG